MKKPTIFIDIDGTILEYRSNEEEIINMPEQKPTPGTVEKFNEWKEKGYYVVVISARPDTHGMWLLTKNLLEKLNLKHDRLMLGITSGVRYMINDEKPSIKETAIGITIERNKGIGGLEI